MDGRHETEGWHTEREKNELTWRTPPPHPPNHKVIRKGEKMHTRTHLEWLEAQTGGGVVIDGRELVKVCACAGEKVM